METVKYFEESGLMNKSINKTIENEAKKQKGGFTSKLMDTLGPSLLWNMLASKEVI